MDRQRYPRFCNKDVEHSFAHWILHSERHEIATCRWCELNMHIVAYAVSIYIEHILNEWYIQNAGSNSVVFMQAFINTKQAEDLLSRTCHLLEQQRDLQSEDTFYEVAKRNLQDIIDTFFPGLQGIMTNIRLSYDAYMYMPLLKYNDTFNMLSQLYMEAVQQGGSNYRSQCFLLTAWHMNGLVAINPACVWSMWGEGMCNDLIVWISTSNDQVWEKSKRP